MVASYEPHDITAIAMKSRDAFGNKYGRQSSSGKFALRPAICFLWHDEAMGWAIILSMSLTAAWRPASAFEPPLVGAVDKSMPIRVNNPKSLPAWQIPSERVALGEAYKPSMAMLASGELVMVALIQDQLPGGKVREWTPLWRSSDGGRTWSERAELKDMIGREQWLTCTSDGTLLATCHLLVQDVNNRDGYTHSYLHRSTDGGRTWQRQRISAQKFPSPPEKGTTLSRNVVELPDGTLLLGVGVNEYDSGKVAFLWKSRDGGASWDKSGSRVTIGGYGDRPYHNWDSFFSEDFTFLTRSGKLLHFIRCGPPAQMYPMNDGRPTPTLDDSGDRTMRCESEDGGGTWGAVRDHGDYGMMYPRVIWLADGRLLMTFTQRSLVYPIGLQAILSGDEGETWDFDHDRIVIEGKTPWGMPSGGGFGNTLQLADGTLVSCYSYRAADNKTYVEVARWRLPDRSDSNGNITISGCRLDLRD
jgi:hypothetical protein